MGGIKNEIGAPNPRRRFAVVEVVEEESRPWWMIYRTAFLRVSFFLLAMSVGYKLFAILNPPNEAMKIQQAAKVLGIPMTGKNLLGVTFVKSSPEGDSMNLTYKCVNCGYEGPTFVMQYPNEPGPGWRKHDLAPIIQPLTTTAAASAMEPE